MDINANIYPHFDCQTVTKYSAIILASFDNLIKLNLCNNSVQTYFQCINVLSQFTLGSWKPQASILSFNFSLNAWKTIIA